MGCGSRKNKGIFVSLSCKKLFDDLSCRLLFPFASHGLDCEGFPRIRGDRPQEQGQSIHQTLFPPHTRG